jgi:hypothetical protein
MIYILISAMPFSNPDAEASAQNKNALFSVVHSVFCLCRNKREWTNERKREKREEYQQSGARFTNI